MADVQPFVATRYNTNNNKLADVVTPPYDVIDKEMQQGFYDKNEHNFVRIDFGKNQPGDDEYENRYSRAETLWKAWRKQGVLTEEPKKCFYVYEQEFALPNGQLVRRKGFFAAVKIQDFSEGGIRAHEHTFDGPKADRFRLMRATHSNLSPIFCLFDDARKKVDALLNDGIEGKKPVECDFDGIINRLWVINKTSIVQALTEAMADQTLYIADGHHRYETSLAYRNEMRQALGTKSGNQPYDYVMMYLNNIHDDGMVILPTHRVLSKDISDDVDIDEVLDDLKENFEVEPVEVDCTDLKATAGKLTAQLEKAIENGGIAFTMVLPKCRTYLLKLKADANINEMIDDEDVALDIKELDVSILHRYIVNRIWLGNPEIDLDDEDVFYVKDADDVLKRMKSGKFGAGFLLNPTRIDQVCSIAGKSLRMPHKSTYFYPKLVTGLVMRDLNSPW